LILPGYEGKIKYAQFLNDYSELKYQPAANGDLELTLPKVKPRFEIPVVELMLK
jgi:alpha-L-fucosidase